MPLHRATGNHKLGFALATTTMLIWATLPLFLEVLLEVMDPYSITWYRFTISTLCLGVILWWRGALPDLRLLTPQSWLLLATASLGLAANYITFLVGLQLTSAASAQVLIQLGPLLLALGGVVVFREHFTRAQWLGFGVLVSGLVTFFGSELSGLVSDAQRYTLGVASIGISAFTWAIYGLAQKQLLRLMPSHSLLLCIFVGCSLCFTPFAAPRQISALGPVELGALAFCMMATIVAYGCFSASLEHLEASRVSAVIALVPIGTLALVATVGSLLPRESLTDGLTRISLLGASMVVAGSLTTALGGVAPEHVEALETELG